MSKNVDIDLLARLFQDRYALLVRVAARYAPSPDQVYDVVQDVFIDFVQFVAKYETSEPEKDADAILIRLCKARAIEAWRKQRRFDSAGVRKIGEHFFEKLSEPRPEESDRLQDEMDALNECVERLSEKARNLVRWFYFDRLSMEEVAAKSEIKPNTIRKTFTRIRRLLAECIQKTLHDP